MSKTLYSVTIDQTGEIETDLSMSKFLIKHGIDVNKLDGTGTTPLLAMLKNSKGSWDKQMELTELFLKAGADVSRDKNEETTVLMEAVDQENPDLVKVLLKAGADVNAVRKHETALLRILNRLSTFGLFVPYHLAEAS